MSSNHDALMSRLEKAVQQIEAYASKVSSNISTAVHNATHSNSAAPEQTQAVTDWNTLLATYLTPFVDAANKFPDTKKYGEWADTSFHHIGTVIAASAVSKKPTDTELLSFLNPVVQVITSAQAPPDPKSAYVQHAKAFAEGITSLQWVTVAPPNGLPKDVAQAGYEAADFYLIKILTEGKKRGGKEGEDFASFASTFKQLLVKQTEYVKQHFPTGLEWSFNGQPLTSYSATSTSAVPPPPSAPDAPPAPSFSSQASNAASSAATAVAGGMGAVFGQLSTLGDSVTGGLKKVTADMKTKNLKDKPALEPKATPSAPKPAAAATTTTTAAGPAKAKKEAKMYNSKGTWFVEYYEGGSLTMSQVELKESVYILGCSNTSVTVPVKCKSIQVDGCKRLTVEFKQVVSMFEVVNSDRVTVYATDNVPSISIDKTDGASIHLSRTAVANPPQIVTSKVSELNLVVPGKTDEDDPVEIPLPEQYITTYENGKIKTESVAHSAN